MFCFSGDQSLSGRNRREAEKKQQNQLLVTTLKKELPIRQLRCGGTLLKWNWAQ